MRQGSTPLKSNYSHCNFFNFGYCILKVTASCFEQVVCRDLPAWVDRVYQIKTDENVIETLRSELLRFLAMSASPCSNEDILSHMPSVGTSAIDHMRAMVEIGLVVKRDTGARSFYCLSLKARTQHVYPFENLLRRVELEHIDELECIEVRVQLYELCRHAADMFGDKIINILIVLHRSISTKPRFSVGKRQSLIAALESFYQMVCDRKERFVQASKASNLLGHRGRKERLSELTIAELFAELVSAYRIIDEIREAALEVARNDFSVIEERVNALLSIMICQLDHFLWVVKPIAQMAEQKLGIRGFHGIDKNAGGAESSAPEQTDSPKHRNRFPKGTLGVIPLLGILAAIPLIALVVVIIGRGGLNLPYLVEDWPQLTSLLNIGNAAPAQPGVFGVPFLIGMVASGGAKRGDTSRTPRYPALSDGRVRRPLRQYPALSEGLMRRPLRREPSLESLPGYPRFGLGPTLESAPFSLRSVSILFSAAATEVIGVI